MGDAGRSANGRFLPVAGLDALIGVLRDDGYQVIGPTVDQGAIVYAEITGTDDLPRGWTEVHAPGRYRLEQRDDEALFGYVVGPDSWKKYLFPPRATVARADLDADGWQICAIHEPEPRYAFLGVRACDIAAIEVQDRTFLQGPYVDPVYRRRREQALLVAVNCTEAAPTCFCTSMGTGPRCGSGYDLGLTEIGGGFVVEVGSDAGAEVLGRVVSRAAESADLDAAHAARARAVAQIERHMDTRGIRDLLLGSLEHPRWDDVAGRCLSCTNCTMVCPTCFCSTVEEVSDLAGEHVERRRQWDSCFNVAFSYMNGGVVRNDIRARYRQWLTHKLASWHDQFGVSGCVGCGRCITWCPVGIDLTEEVAVIRGDTV